MCPRDYTGHVITTLGTREIQSLSTLINMFQNVPNSFWEAMNSLEVEKWQVATDKEYEGLMDMGIWKPVPRPKDPKTIKCRWSFVYKSDG